ncbi:triose-phosphate isomerase [Desulforudis sp. 1088]|jgi:triosephosphate isomerase|uniref:triose-phosphate isomerase n=2 Tax=Candidatus Desulforudis TaxID=471826 RepID=UPI00346E90F6
MRTPIIAANWKMYKTPSEAAAFAKKLKLAVAGWVGIEIVLCPAFPALEAVAAVLKGGAIGLGAQNMFWADEGAYTGEVSAPMLKEAGCGFVILGHSERRQYFGETDELVNRKVVAALKHGLTPVVCVGETIEQRKAGRTADVVGTQLAGCLKGLSPEQAAGLVVAYEPVWAIGTGHTASDEDAQEVCALIRRAVARDFGPGAADAVRIQYGGSVKPENTRGLLSQPDIDGALVGGASLSLAGFEAIVNVTREVYGS